MCPSPNQNLPRQCASKVAWKEKRTGIGAVLSTDCTYKRVAAAMQNQQAKTCLDAKRKTMCKCTKDVASPKACKSRRTSLSFEPPMH